MRLKGSNIHESRRILRAHVSPRESLSCGQFNDGKDNVRSYSDNSYFLIKTLEVRKRDSADALGINLSI